MKAKRRIVNARKPVKGAVAIMEVGKYGHVGGVLSVRNNVIKIEEANYLRCKITHRWGNARELKIVGYNVKKLSWLQRAINAYYRRYRRRHGRNPTKGLLNKFLKGLKK